MRTYDLLIIYDKTHSHLVKEKWETKLGIQVDDDHESYCSKICMLKASAGSVTPLKKLTDTHLHNASETYLLISVFTLSLIVLCFLLEY